MTEISPSFMLEVVLAVASAVGVYAAIKSDLTRAILTAQTAEKNADKAQAAADEAHGRLSDHIDRHHTGR
jgi:hypothetical protein